MKKLSKIAQVTFFAAAFAVLFSGTADAYIDPSVMNYAIIFLEQKYVILRILLFG